MKRQYECPIYNLDNLYDNRTDEIQFTVDDRLFFGHCLLKYEANLPHILLIKKVIEREKSKKIFLAQNLKKKHFKYTIR